ncbi:hypothetical protein CJU90_5792 [Yarrowia sp. C11]|nr:hypothetical protein CJU90_5792 [Yarrowia sp. C11]KAG5364371.1 hypothetical protein CKK34_3170 [Yarrowia sp. E02]
MPTVHTEIEIDAPAAVVSQILYQFNKYPEWNTFLTFVMGNANDYSHRPEELANEHITIQVWTPGKQKPQIFDCEVNKWEPNNLSWEGTLLSKHIIRGEHYFEIVPVSENKCIFKHGEHFSGVVATVASFTSIFENLEPSYKRFNQEMKKRAETGLSRL